AAEDGVRPGPGLRRQRRRRQAPRRRRRRRGRAVRRAEAVHRARGRQARAGRRRRVGAEPDVAARPQGAAAPLAALAEDLGRRAGGARPGRRRRPRGRRRLRRRQDLRAQPAPAPQDARLRRLHDQGLRRGRPLAAGARGQDHLLPGLGHTAGMSVPCSRFFHGDLKSGPEAARPDGAHSGAKRHCFHLGELPGPGSLPASIAGGARRFFGSVSASEVEQSEDYTCIIARGPNPKTTHIFGDCILEPQTTVGKSDEAAMEPKDGASAKSYLVVKRDTEAAAGPGEDFLSSCFTCTKKLEGNDIYIYRKNFILVS
uniref:FLZ-type domain-containing protein n=1 Tax=Aegilops tauschii subsp. strangulata TaxID=200361 RepID=A0A453E8Q8_AEGTS